MMIYALTFPILQVKGGYKYGAPYDSTQGVPGFVFVGFWIIILLFALRTAWEFRDKIFVKNTDPDKKKSPAKKPTPGQL